MSVAMVNSNLHRPWLAQASEAVGQQAQQRQNQQENLKAHESPAFGKSPQPGQTQMVDAVQNDAAVRFGLNELLAAMVNPQFRVNEVYQAARRPASYSWLA
ncbi:MAG: hypothetical protein KC474_02685 [Cyanobacteria bacterium HKST-UBA04]|nr:hypothetical protein [Cyanobacteria bacterium HKST-UBA05]MCA9798428.1 hypothetical protein [Cyanobacteria bacterium HKST-UBA04]MCA9841079.1 hypothetical protein [Cyanobacteria bacterium HKST-UBA03]